MSDQGFFFFKRWNIYFKTFCVKNKIPDRSSDCLCGISSTKNTALLATRSVFCFPAVTKCLSRNTVTVHPLYARVKCGKWGKNEEHLRCIKFATGWTVTLTYWAAVKQGLTTSRLYRLHFPDLGKKEKKNSKHLCPLPQKYWKGGKELTWGESWGASLR